MKKELLAATALTTAALAPSFGHAQIASPINWTGVYVSLAAGTGFLKDTVTTDIHGNAEFTGKAWFGTMGVGTNWTVGAAVLGWDVDVNFLSSHHSGFTDGGASVETSLERLMTARAKLGVAAGNVLLYSTGGLAVGNASLSTSFTDPGKGGGTSSGSRSDTLIGWTAGGGATYAANNRVALTVEGLYYRLSPLDVTTTGTALSNYTASYTPQGWLVKAGIQVKLN